MNWANLSVGELIGTVLGLFFTLSIFSYILGDNVLFRLAIHIFIGVAAGFMASVVLHSVIIPRLFIPMFSGSQSERVFALVPLILSALLLLKATKRYSVWGSPVMAFLVGIGAATAIGGAMIGTLFPQVNASINLFDLQAIIQSGQDWLVQFFYGGIIVCGTISTFAYFNFAARTRTRKIFQGSFILQGIAWIGQAFIAITFGVLYAGTIGAALTALVERLSFVWNFIFPFVGSAS